MSTIKILHQRIEESEKELNEIISIIEVLDPTRNDTSANDRTDHATGKEMVHYPMFKAWFKSVKITNYMRLKRSGWDKETQIQLSRETIDIISKGLCSRRDELRIEIKELNERFDKPSNH